MVTEIGKAEEQLRQKLADLYVSYRQRYIICLPGGRIIMPKKKDGRFCK